MPSPSQCVAPSPTSSNEPRAPDEFCCTNDTPIGELCGSVS
eukprot:CAMPEP_0185776418 /NCGR_PEP_ID=MMETSP1174-20130828/85632_1 /TAXON_ID=35687 /ORGANISM="Dictyocha speculum, Strain CCMP1381" /LENGTH=40 /DNA_ID= /DNA_START= /DNA_END= /DNA_ORIENTATION=